MKKYLLFIGLFLGLFSGLVIYAYAKDDSCTNWSTQTNGCDQRVCTRESDAQMYCQEICPGETVIRNITCE